MSETNKTDAVRDAVFRAILRGQYAPGSRLPPERLMAEQSGTSRVTVRRAYDALYAAGILERSQGSGTYVARHAGGNPAAGGPVALLAGIDSRFALGFIRALEAALTEAGLLLVLRLTDDRPELEEAAAIDMVAQGLRNLVLWPGGARFPESTFARLRVLGVNLVFFDRMLPGDYADFVGLDNAAALESLFAQADQDGLADPVFVAHADLQADSDGARQAAYTRLCAARGLAAPVVALPQGQALAALPAALAGARSIFCVNDAMALLLRPHLLPGQRLYGVDGLAPGVTSYAQPLADMARAVVAALRRQQALGPAWSAQTLRFTGRLVHHSP